MEFLVKYPIFYYLLQFTWGILMNIVGGGMALFMLITGHKPHRHGPAIYFRLKKMDGFGFSLGMFFVIGKTADSVKDHEFGHTLQNITYGPIAPFIVYIPSVIRYQYFNFKYWHKGDYSHDYGRIWFERDATLWGTAFMAYWIAHRGN